MLFVITFLLIIYIVYNYINFDIDANTTVVNSLTPTSSQSTI